MFKKILKYNSSKIWFISDPHFYHKNIIEYAARPFDSVEEMTEAIISNWNSVVKTDDDIFVAGDFAFTGNIEKIRSLIERLNGHIHLILGNHDHQNNFVRDAIISLFASVQDYLEIDVIDEEMEEPQRIILSHYPMITWNKKGYGSWQLYGHIHSGPRSSASERGIITSITQYDVGVDNNNFFPVSYEKIKMIITKRFLKIE